MRSLRTATLALAAASTLTFATACGSDTDTSAGGSTDTQTASESEGSPSDSESSESMDPMDSMDPMAMLVGSGCAGYAEKVPDGAGSVAGMAQDPVAVAASNNPLLKTLTKAVSGKLNPKVNLVDTLNSGQFTVLAPTDKAFGELPKETVTALTKPENAEKLTTILTYHVVEGQLSPEEIAGQTLTTVQGDTVKVSGSGGDLTFNDANLVCGGVQTANATVYMIDSVLMPPKM